MITVLIRTELRKDADLREYNAADARMFKLAKSMPGFVSAATWVDQDGKDVSVLRFADHESLHSWRDHPEHAAVQRLGRETFYSYYEVEVLDQVRHYRFDIACGRQELHPNGA